MKKIKTYTLRMPPEKYEKLQKVANCKNVSVNDLILYLISNYLEAED